MIAQWELVDQWYIQRRLLGPTAGPLGQATDTKEGFGGSPS